MSVGILGSNRDSTATGKRLRDGGACLLSHSGIDAIAEERLTRRKHAGGAKRSLEFVMSQYDRSDVDMWVETSCCEPLPNPNANRQALKSIQHRTISHHLAHAYSAYYPSPFDAALVVVADCGGTTLAGNDKDWWKNSREQVTYYIGTGSDLEVAARDFCAPYSLGFGELFRAATHALGWATSTKAGNTMALAGLTEQFNGPLVYELRAGQLYTSVPVDPANPIRVAMEVGRRSGVRIPPREPRGAIRDEHIVFASLVQESLYQGLKAQLLELTLRTGLRKVCFAGGVALNCIAVGRLVRDGVVDAVYVQPAAGDSGQCLGAALAGARMLGLRRDEIGGLSTFTPYLGGKYGTAEALRAVDDFLQAGARIEIVDGENPALLAAKMVEAGALVGIFTDRSEFGPRALGARSIVADPRSLFVRKRLVHMKQRDEFMPFGPSVLEEHYQSFFSGPSSPTMTVASNALPSTTRSLPGVVHVDGSVRVHLVGSRPAAFRKVIEAFDNLTGIPILTNTSFNGPGQPIVETPYDAIELLTSSELDAVMFDQFVVTKKS